MKKIFKRSLAVMLTVVMLLGIAPMSEIAKLDFSWLNFSAKASALGSSGSCGSNVTYTFDSSTGLLTISGTGTMRNYGYQGSPFYGNSSIKNVVINNGVTSIGSSAFYYCTSLTSITIPDSVTSIGNYAFSGCIGLTSVTIGNSVTSIGNEAFSGCSGLKSITIPDSVTSIGYDAFEGCTGLKSITIPDSVTSIGNGAFYNCTGLTSVTIGNSVTSIGYRAFCGCTGLKSITIPDSVVSIYGSAFYDCNGLKSITISDSVTSIGEYAFYNTGYYNDRTNWENGVLYIGNHLIEAKDTISAVYAIKDGTKTIADSAFYNCKNLTSITIPDSVTSIGSQAFYYCTGLTSITIPDSVTSIGDYAFYGCTGLKDVYYAGTAEEWKRISIGSDNSPLTSANIHYGRSDSESESYDNKVYTNVDVGSTNISFNPAWLASDSINYNHSLAQLASQFAMLGYSKKSELKEALEAIGFKVENFDGVSAINLNTGVPASGEATTEEAKKRVNYFIASKQILVSGKVYNLVFAGFIGSDHNQWYSNFDPGTGETHQGFNNAKNYVLDKLDKFIKYKGFTKENTKILLTGHSRGAATANLVAAELIKNNRYSYNGNIYTYTFATPNPTRDSDRGNKIYNRIFNFVNPEDFVTKCMPAQWGYGRYGITYTLPSKTNEAKNYASYYNSMNKLFYKYTGENYSPYKEGEAEVYEVVKKMTSTIPNVNAMYSDAYKLNSGTGDKTAYEFFQESLCPIVAEKSGSSAWTDGLTNMIIAWINPFTSLTYNKITKFFLKSEGASMVADKLKSEGIVISALAAPQLLSALGITLQIYSTFKVEQLLYWATTNGPNFSHAHLAETYAAFLCSMTQEQVCKKGRKSYQGTVNCPVDVEVYDKTTGELVGRIVDNVVDETIAAKENSIVMLVDGDSKQYWLPADGDYEVKLIGNDNGTMDYTMSVVDSDIGETERINFFDVEITDGKTMTGEVEGETFAIEDYSLELENGEALEPTEQKNNVAEIEIKTAASGNGTVSESITATSGDYVTVYATPDEGHGFKGWYDGDELVSTDSEYSFVAKEFVLLTASFEPILSKISSVSVEDLSLNYKMSASLNPEIIADDDAEYTVSYSSDSKNVTVDENGKIYGAKKGTANITVTVTDSQGNTVTDTCKVTVEYTWWQWLIKIVLFGWIWY